MPSVHGTCHSRLHSMPVLCCSEEWIACLIWELIYLTYHSWTSDLRYYWRVHAYVWLLDWLMGGLNHCRQTLLFWDIDELYAQFVSYGHTCGLWLMLYFVGYQCSWPSFHEHWECRSFCAFKNLFLQSNCTTSFFRIIMFVEICDSCYCLSFSAFKSSASLRIWETECQYMCSRIFENAIYMYITLHRSWFEFNYQRWTLIVCWVLEVLCQDLTPSVSKCQPDSINSISI